jgi:hypothetical protein
MLFASQLVLAYMIAKVSAVAGDPAVAAALLCCSIEKKDDYRTGNCFCYRTIGISII